MMAENPTQQLFDLWKKQTGDAGQAWLKMLGQGQTGDPQAFWRPFMGQNMAARWRVMTHGAASPDLMAQWKQSLDQWIAAWAKVLEQAMSPEAFAKAMGKQLETFLSAATPAKKAAEQQTEAPLSALGVASRTQVVSLAAQLVQVEEKIEGLEDRLDTILQRLNALGTAVKKGRA